MILGRIKIRTRIYAGFGSLVLLGLVVAAVGSWGINGLGHQSVRMSALAADLRSVATSAQGEKTIELILLHARNEPEDDMRAPFHQAQEKVQQSLAEAKTETLSIERKGIYQKVLDRLDEQAQSADRSFDLDRKLVEARTQMSKDGGAFTAATARLVEAARKAQSSDIALAAATVEQSVVLTRVAALRFEVTVNEERQIAFRTSAAAAVAVA